MKTPPMIPRDPVKPSSYFMKLASLELGAIRAAEKLKSSGALTSLIARHVRTSLALYSAGAAPAECLGHVEMAARSLIEKLKRSASRPIVGIPDIVPYVEACAGARIAGLHEELWSAYRSAAFGDIREWQRSLLDGLLSVFGLDRKAITANLRGAPAEYGPLLATLISHARADTPVSFNKRLDDYLVKEWGPVADRRARGDLSAPSSMHEGRWTLLGPALTLATGHAPSLSAKAMEYFPIDLLVSSASSPRKATTGQARSHIARESKESRKVVAPNANRAAPGSSRPKRALRR